MQLLRTVFFVDFTCKQQYILIRAKPIPHLFYWWKEIFHITFPYKIDYSFDWVVERLVNKAESILEKTACGTSCFRLRVKRNSHYVWSRFWIHRRTVILQTNRSTPPVRFIWCTPASEGLIGALVDPVQFAFLFYFLLYRRLRFTCRARRKSQKKLPKWAFHTRHSQKVSVKVFTRDIHKPFHTRHSRK